MSKIDKIIQIQMHKVGADNDYLMYGLSESGTLYSRMAGTTWSEMLDSPVVDNSACEVDEVSKYDIPPVSCGGDLERFRVEHCKRVLDDLGKGTQND